MTSENHSNETFRLPLRRKEDDKSVPTIELKRSSFITKNFNPRNGSGPAPHGSQDAIIKSMPSHNPTMYVQDILPTTTTTSTKSQHINSPERPGHNVESFELFRVLGLVMAVLLAARLDPWTEAANAISDFDLFKAYGVSAVKGIVNAQPYAIFQAVFGDITNGGTRLAKGLSLRSLARVHRACRVQGDITAGGYNDYSGWRAWVVEITAAPHLKNTFSRSLAAKSPSAVVAHYGPGPCETLEKSSEFVMDLIRAYFGTSPVHSMNLRTTMIILDLHCNGSPSTPGAMILRAFAFPRKGITFNGSANPQRHMANSADASNLFIDLHSLFSKDDGPSVRDLGGVSLSATLEDANIQKRDLAASMLARNWIWMYNEYMNLGAVVQHRKSIDAAAAAHIFKTILHHGRRGQLLVATQRKDATTTAPSLLGNIDGSSWARGAGTLPLISGPGNVRNRAPGNSKKRHNQTSDTVKNSRAQGRSKKLSNMPRDGPAEREDSSPEDTCDAERTDPQVGGSRIWVCPFAIAYPRECSHRAYNCSPCQGYRDIAAIVTHVERKHLVDKENKDGPIKPDPQGDKTRLRLREVMARCWSSREKWEAAFLYLRPDATEIPSPYEEDYEHFELAYVRSLEDRLRQTVADRNRLQQENAALRRECEDARSRQTAADTKMLQREREIAALHENNASMRDFARRLLGHLSGEQSQQPWSAYGMETPGPRPDLPDRLLQPLPQSDLASDSNTDPQVQRQPLPELLDLTLSNVGAFMDDVNDGSRIQNEEPTSPSVRTDPTTTASLEQHSTVATEVSQFLPQPAQSGLDFCLDSSDDFGYFGQDPISGLPGTTEQSFTPSGADANLNPTGAPSTLDTLVKTTPATEDKEGSDEDSLLDKFIHREAYHR